MALLPFVVPRVPYTASSAIILKTYIYCFFAASKPAFQQHRNGCNKDDGNSIEFVYRVLEFRPANNNISQMEKTEEVNKSRKEEFGMSPIGTTSRQTKKHRLYFCAEFFF